MRMPCYVTLKSRTCTRPATTETIKMSTVDLDLVPTTLANKPANVISVSLVSVIGNGQVLSREEKTTTRYNN